MSCNFLIYLVLVWMIVMWDLEYILFEVSENIEDKIFFVFEIYFLVFWYFNYYFDLEESDYLVLGRILKFDFCDS